MEMSEKTETNEYLCLKLLLNKWKLPHLLYHFLAQKIDVDVLKMMKPHHIGDTLSGFAIGDRIRFEYELENWRHRMGIPLGSSTPLTELPKNFSNEQATAQVFEIVENGESETPVEEPKATNSVAESTKSQETSKSTMSEIPTFTINRPQNISQNPAPKENLRSNSLRSSKTCSQFSAAPAQATTKKRNTSNFVPPKELIASPFNLDARNILMQCVPRGPQLMQIFETRRSFTVAERGELINLYAKFFYHNSIHLSLKMSYVLENQILKLFPGERLKDYRTEKRGRIYIRLGNIKNFRTRRAKAKTRERSLQQFIISNLEDDDDQAIMIDDELDEIQIRNESHTPDHVLCDDFKTDIESNSTDHFLCTEIKTETQENNIFEPKTQLVETEKNTECYFE